jgi:crotonobetaine/carnitine-CoA ligase
MRELAVSRAVPLTGRDLWRHRVEVDCDRPFLRWGEQIWTYDEADVAMRRLAAGLQARGVGFGTRVLVGVDNSPEAVFCHLALRELGAVMVALVPGLKLDELSYQVVHSEGEVLVAGGEVAETLTGGLGEFRGLRQVVLDRLRPDSGPQAHSLLSDLSAHDPLPVTELPGYGPMSPSVIMYTSGSTARPKGIILPAGSLASAGAGFVSRYGIGADDNFLLPFTVAHGVGGLVAPGIALNTGCQLTLEPKFSPSRFWQRVEATDATVSLLFPAQMQLLLRLAEPRPPAWSSSLRLVISHEDSPPFRERFDAEIRTVWSCTESGANGTGSEAGQLAGRAPGYVGTVYGDELLEIRGPQGRVLPPGEVGEIHIKHPYVMLEYLGDPDGTSQILRDGWIATQDLGLLTEDGHLYYRGRIKNMIKRSGENVSPEQVEQILLEHPAVISCVVFSVPDSIRTEEVGAAVHIRSDEHAGELSDFVARRLARWKAPRYVWATTEPLPRLANGKLDRQLIRQTSSPDVAWDRERDQGR